MSNDAEEGNEGCGDDTEDEEEEAMVSTNERSGATPNS